MTRDESPKPGDSGGQEDAPVAVARPFEATPALVRTRLPVQGSLAPWGGLVVATGCYLAWAASLLWSGVAMDEPSLFAVVLGGAVLLAMCGLAAGSWTYGVRIRRDGGSLLVEGLPNEANLSDADLLPGRWLRVRARLLSGPRGHLHSGQAQVLLTLEGEEESLPLGYLALRDWEESGPGLRELAAHLEAELVVDDVLAA